MVANDSMQLLAEKPVHGGAVLATAPDGRRVFLRGAIEGESVNATVTAEHKNYLWADTTEVLEASPHRVEHVWPEGAARGVGGAELGHVEPEYQLVWKSQVLNEQLSRIGGEAVKEQIARFAPSGVLVRGTGSTELGTRTRLQLVAGRSGALGMRPFRSNQVVAVHDYPLAVPAIQDIAQLWKKPKGLAWANRWRPGQKVSIEAPAESDPVVVTKSGVFRLLDGTEFKGMSRWAATVDGVTKQYRVRPGGFWQTHVDAPSILANAVITAAAPKAGQTVLELYSGAGLFSAWLADRIGSAGQLLSLEGSALAVEDAGRNLAEAVTDRRAELFQGNVDAQSVAELAAEAETKADTVVLDPPRKGAGSGVLRAVAETGADRVILVSCDPAAAARDLSDLRQLGYSIEDLSAWDLFPHTHHFESVATLIR